MELTLEGDSTRAVEVLDRAMAEMPLGQFLADDMMVDVIEGYYAAGAMDKGNALAREVGDVWIEYLEYFRRPEFRTGRLREAIFEEYYLKQRSFETLFAVVWQYKQQELVDYFEPYYEY
jgi:uncharacterized protein (DUF3820 family)